jgi:hypothetical protein
MTVKELRDLLGDYPDTFEVRRHDSDYGAREITEVTQVYGVLTRRYVWTETDANEVMPEEGEVVSELVVLR